MIVREIQCRSLVNPTGGFLDAFTHSLNPYGGCSYGGTLCGMPDYAPEIARVRGERRVWGTYLDVKMNAVEVYAREHDRIRGGARPSLRIYMSSVTDPYVPQEKRYRITRGLLEAMIDRPPDLLALQTHTPHPLRDLDLLVALSRRAALSVQISVETDREDLGPLFPRHAFTVRSRLEALRRLHAAGLHTVAVVAPLWPLDDAERFARRLEEVSSFVVLDHYLLGDGSPGGSRTARRVVAPGQTFPQRLCAAGFEPWTRRETFDAVAGVFRDVLGDRVGLSKEGFSQAAGRVLSNARIRREEVP
jgi:DNA repair photolyase